MRHNTHFSFFMSQDYVIMFVASRRAQKTLRKVLKAIESSDTGTVKQFLDMRRLQPSAILKVGMTTMPVLNYAIYWSSGRSDEIIHLLIDRGANIHQREYNNMTALDRACWAAKATVVERLLELKSNVGGDIDATNTPLAYFLSRPHSSYQVLEILLYAGGFKGLSGRSIDRLVYRGSTNPNSLAAFEKAMKWIGHLRF